MKKTLPFLLFILPLIALFLYACKKDPPDTEGPPTVSTLPVTDITETSAMSGGHITDDGGPDIQAKGVVWDTTPLPTVENPVGISNEGTGSGVFISSLPGLTPFKQYYVRAYATNEKGTSYGDPVGFFTARDTIHLPMVQTDAASNITPFASTTGGHVTSQGTSSVTARGVCWGISSDPDLTGNHTSDGSGTGTFTSSLTGLTPNTTYYVRAYATNITGTVFGNQIDFTTDTSTAPAYPPGFVHCDPSNPTEVVEVISPATGKTWMDRNLGASRVASASGYIPAFGDLYQWGRFADGHQCRNSTITTMPSSTDQPAHGNFICPSGTPYDWRTPQNQNLWRGSAYVNNPCPIGYRVPTEAELNDERLSWSSNTPAGAFASPLKLTAAGFRNPSGTIYDAGSAGRYWSCTPGGENSRYLKFDPSGALTSTSRGIGQSVRCIKF